MDIFVADFSLWFPILSETGILERLNAGEVLTGDGGMTYALEKRGYVKAGPWTPECNVEHPDGGQFFFFNLRTISASIATYY